jgi:hypothetical protein
MVSLEAVVGRWCPAGQQQVSGAGSWGFCTYRTAAFQAVSLHQKHSYLQLNWKHRWRGPAGQQVQHMRAPQHSSRTSPGTSPSTAAQTPWQHKPMTCTTGHRPGTHLLPSVHSRQTHQQPTSCWACVWWCGGTRSRSAGAALKTSAHTGEEGAGVEFFWGEGDCPLTGPQECLQFSCTLLAS